MRRPRPPSPGVVLVAAAVVIGIIAGGYAAKRLSEGGAATPPSPAAQILTLLNARRHSAGLSSLRADLDLAALARAHNRDMRANGYFAHDAPQGQTFAERVAYLRRSLAGETIAWGTGGFGTPAGIVSLWMASPPHRHVILTPGMRRVGISVLSGAFLGQSHASVATADFSS